MTQSVKLISYSQSPKGNEEKESLLDLIAYCARVSNPDNQNNKKTSEKIRRNKKNLGENTKK